MIFLPDKFEIFYGKLGSCRKRVLPAIFLKKLDYNLEIINTKHFKKQEL